MADKERSWVSRALSGGRYKVDQKLGAGGMAHVYRAWDGTLQTYIVVKVPRKELLEQPGMADRFQQEIRSLVQLTHPHIVRVLDVGQHDGVPFAVMQFLAGGSLDDRHQSGANGYFVPVAPQSLDVWLPVVAKALDYIHGKHYVHRDIKPENILFDEDGNPFLSDFGIAKAFADSRTLTDPGKVLGTADYMAPEVVLDEKYDGRADQYSLAVMVYELLAGRPPFPAKTPAAALVDKTTKRAPSLSTVAPHLPKPLCTAVDQALSKDPRRRFADCRSFANTVLQAASAIGTPAADSPRTAPPAAAPPAAPAKPQLVCCVCRTTLAIPANAGGKIIQCPSCKQPLRVLENLRGLERVGRPEPVGQGAARRPALPTHRGAGQIVPAAAVPSHVAMQPTSRQSVAATQQSRTAGPKPKMAPWKVLAIVAAAMAALLFVAVFGLILLAIFVFGEANGGPVPIGDDDDGPIVAVQSGKVYVDNKTDQQVKLDISRYYDASGVEQIIDAYWNFEPNEENYLLLDGSNIVASKVHFSFTTSDGTTSWNSDFFNDDGDLYISINPDELPATGYVQSGDVLVDNQTDQTVEFRIVRYYDENGAEQHSNLYWSFEPDEKAFIADSDVRIRARKVHFSFTSPAGVTYWNSEFFDDDGSLYITIVQEDLTP